MVAYLLAVDRGQLYFLPFADPQSSTLFPYTTLFRKTTRITQRADCQVLRLPTERRRSNSRGSLRIVSGLAENTHSIFCDGPHGPETVNGCPVLRRQEPPPRGTRARLRVPTGSTVRAPPKRASGESFSPLTKTYMDVGNRKLGTPAQNAPRCPATRDSSAPSVRASSNLLRISHAAKHPDNLRRD